MKLNFRFNVLNVVIVPVLLLWLTGEAVAQGPGPHPLGQPSAINGDSVTLQRTQVTLSALAPQTPVGTAFTYQGQIKKGTASITANCSMAFCLYDQATGGNQVGSPITLTAPVNNSLFTVPLDFGSAAFPGDARWLDVQVQCPGDSAYTDLGRQAITAAPYALSLQPGSVISGSIYDRPVLQVYNTDPSPSGGGYAISAINYSGNTWRPAIYGENKGASAGVYGRSDGWHAVVGWNQNNNWAGVWGYNGVAGFGVRGESAGGIGVYGSAPTTGTVGIATSTSGVTSGVYGRSDSAGSWNPDTPRPGGIGVYGENNLERGTGVQGQADSGYGVYGLANSSVGSGGYFNNTGGGVGLRAGSSGGVAVWASADGGTNSSPTLRVHNNNTANGIAAYLTNNSSYPTIEVDQSGTGRVLDLQTYATSSPGDFIAGFDANTTLLFRIAGNGQGRSNVGWTTPAQDYAEMLPAINGLEPGDVLVIGPDGKLARSTEAYQASVAGVYSTKPGFVGGQSVEGQAEGEIPLAVVGVVPVKISAQNGPIRPGDLLVASSMPGYAMKAGPNPPQGTVIGKALEKLDAGIGLIKILATLQ